MRRQAGGVAVFRSLKSTFSVGTVLVAVCILIVVLTSQFLSNARTTRMIGDFVAQRASETTIFLGGQLGGAVRFGKIEQIEETFAALRADTGGEVIGGLVLSADGREVYVSDEPGFDRGAALTLAREALRSHSTQTGPNGWIVAEPVVFGREGELAGIIATAWTPDIRMEAMRAEHITDIVLSGIVFVVALLAAGLLLWFWLSRPLMAVAKAMQDVASGNLSTEVPGRRRADEIGAIAGALSSLQADLQQAQLTQEENAFRSAAIGGTGSALMLVGPDMKLRYMNGACDSLLGTFAAHAGDDWARFNKDMLTSEGLMSLPGCRTLIADVAAGKKTLPIAKQRRWGRNRLDLRMDGVRNEAGEVIGYVLELEDVSEKALNAAILGAIEKYQLRVDLGEEGKVADFNDAFLSATGLSDAQLRSTTSAKALVSVNSSEQQQKENTAKVMNGEIISGRFELPTQDARKPVAEGIVTPITNSDGDVVRVVFIGADVTDAHYAAIAAEEDRKQRAKEQEEVVDALQLGLGQLAGGDLTVQLTQTFGVAYEQLRQNFNQAVRSLHDAMGAVVQNAKSINSEAADITSGADNLARRTEHQAATLEETAAALDQLTASVQSATAGADEASQIAATAQTQAETGGEVAKQAVTAMDAIKASSQEISKITSVIEDIAFQTNLLALNAGVEAARAGDAGRGFAVVATEVRALAQRSSEAAREINELISASGEQVRTGVDLVDQTGDALARIVSAVADISARVTTIATSAREQSAGLNEINTAMNDLDQVTQQNAAMFEETNAASHALTSEASALVTASAQFKLHQSAQPKRKSLDTPKRAVREVTNGTVRALAPASSAQPWDEF
jgi:methyl-accepting chemotaxis protein